MASTLGRQSDQSVRLQWRELFVRQVADAPPPTPRAACAAVQCVSSHCRGDELLLHWTPTVRADSTGLLMSNKVQYRTALQRKALCSVTRNKRICSSFPVRYLSCACVHVSLSHSAEVSSELSSPAAFQFFLLFFFEFGPDSESLWESCFRFLRLWVRFPLSSLSLSSELLSSSLFLDFALFLSLCRLLVLFLLCLSLATLLSSLLLSLLEHFAFFRCSSSSFFFFFFFFFREDFLERFDKLASVSDLDFFNLWCPIFFVAFIFSLKNKQTKM